MDKMLVLKYLLLMAMIIPVIARLNSVQVISYRKWRKTKYGQVMCAMDPANETTSASSLQDCSLTCARDATCKGINIKNSTTCEVYNYKPKIATFASGCIFYEVYIFIHLILIVFNILVFACTAVIIFRQKKRGQKVFLSRPKSEYSYGLAKPWQKYKTRIFFHLWTGLCSHEKYQPDTSFAAYLFCDFFQKISSDEETIDCLQYGEFV